jgi:tetratricopeptide (TPR) repeat protein
MKKHLLLFSIIMLLTFLCSAQNPIVDSLKLELKKAKHDTVRCAILNQLVEEEGDPEVWPKYNAELKTIAEKNIPLSSVPVLKNTYLKYLAIAIGNIGYEYARNGKIKEAIDSYDKCIELQKKLNDKSGLARTLSSIGNTIVIWEIAIML